MQDEAVYDRAAELKAFDETKTGVKGLVDMAVTKVPRIFVLPPEQRISPTTPITDPAWRVPTLDISGEKLVGSHRLDLVEAIRAACDTWGFFQVVGHGVPMSLMERVIEGIGAFNEGEIETKAALYSREPNRAVKYSSNFDLYRSPVANWRDTLYCRMAPDPPSPAELPADCRSYEGYFLINTKLQPVRNPSLQPQSLTIQGTGSKFPEVRISGGRGRGL